MENGLPQKISEGTNARVQELQNAAHCDKHLEHLEVGVALHVSAVWTVLTCVWYRQIKLNARLAADANFQQTTVPPAKLHQWCGLEAVLGLSTALQHVCICYQAVTEFESWTW